MIAILAVQHHRQQIGAGPAPHNWMKRCRRLGDGLARPAAELFAHGLNNFVLARNDFQSLGGGFAQLGELAAAARANLRARQNLAFTGQMGRQRASHRPLAGEALDRGFGLTGFGFGFGLPGCFGRRLALVLGEGRFQFFELKLQLSEQLAPALRALTILFTPQLGYLNQKVLNHRLGRDRPDFGLSHFSPSRSKRGAQALDDLFRGVGRRGHGQYRITKRRSSLPRNYKYPQKNASIVLTGPLRPEGMARVPPVNAFKHVSQLCR